jgi:hypothetical protein
VTDIGIPGIRVRPASLNTDYSGSRDCQAMQSAFLTYCTLPFWNGVKLCPQFCVGIFLTLKAILYIYTKNVIFCYVPFCGIPYLILCFVLLSSFLHGCPLLCTAVLSSVSLSSLSILYCRTLFYSAVVYLVLSSLLTQVCPSWLSCPYGHKMPIKPILHCFSLSVECIFLSCTITNPFFMSHLLLLCVQSYLSLLYLF